VDLFHANEKDAAIQGRVGIVGELMYFDYDGCDVCFEGKKGLRRAPYSSWMMECKSCRDIREYQKRKREQPDRIETKLDEILKLLKEAP
jgi:hypothetical protein